MFELWDPTNFCHAKDCLPRGMQNIRGYCAYGEPVGFVLGYICSTRVIDNVTFRPIHAFNMQNLVVGITIVQRSRHLAGSHKVRRSLVDHEPRIQRRCGRSPGSCDISAGFHGHAARRDFAQRRGEDRSIQRSNTYEHASRDVWTIMASRCRAHGP